MIIKSHLFMVALLQVALLEPARAADGKPDECGLASVYSTVSEETASGDDTRPEDFTAAHRSLPFGTLIHVNNQENGRTVVVRITDRGPFVSGRIVDLSQIAARELDISGLMLASESTVLTAHTITPPSPTFTAWHLDGGAIDDWDESSTWVELMTDFPNRIIHILRSCPNGLTSKDIAERLGTTQRNVSSRLSKLAAYGIIGRVRGTVAEHGTKGAIYRAPCDAAQDAPI